MARDLHASISQVGLLVTIFAGTVVLSAMPLSALTRNFSRKSLVVVVLLVNAAAGVLAAIAPNYEVLLGARVLGGLAHGLFWAVVGAYAAHLVPKPQIGRAVAITSGGGTAAFVLGVPVGTALGHALGWRLAFASIAVVMVVLAILVVRFLPAVEHRVSLSTGEIPLPARRDRTLPGVIVVCLIIVVMATGHNLFYTYIVPWLIGVVHFSESAVAPLLFLYGGAGAIGLALAGVIADRLPRRGVLIVSGAVLLAVTALALVSQVPWAAVVAFAFWGAVFGGLPAMFQTRMMHVASPRIRDLASALFTTSFNLAIGGGAFLGGALLDRFGLGVLPFVDIAFIVLGLVVSVVSSAWLDARERPLTSPIVQE
ncbi:MAG: transporter [Microbacteriaceae bacterium]|nr:transporter [Microbacteriaceae bacterium]